MRRRLACGWGVVAAGVLGCDGNGVPDAFDQWGREITSAWDTIWVVGSDNPADTTLLDPERVLVWNELVLTLDITHQNVRALSRTDGALLWSLGRVGKGPGEFTNVVDVLVGPDSTPWVVDAENRRVSVLTADGRVEREISLQHLPPSAMYLTSTPDAVFASSHDTEYGMLELGVDSLEIRHVLRLPWQHDPASPFEYDVRMVHATGGAARPLRVAALQLGPGFLVFTSREGFQKHLYIQPIPFAFRPGPKIRAAGADTARWGARDAAVVDDEIFFLFGGRPKRQSHPEGEETRLIDVYGRDGTYRRSYRLPGTAKAMSTIDGETFYILGESDLGVPTLSALRVGQ
ncbi:MAG: hypothetical protein R3E98_09025 [Gemmatimonadota bacterium]|nr:hypothetical protein [Gemmatimonadota bacterium]